MVHYSIVFSLSLSFIMPASRLRALRKQSQTKAKLLYCPTSTVVATPTAVGKKRPRATYESILAEVRDHLEFQDYIKGVLIMKETNGDTEGVKQIQKVLEKSEKCKAPTEKQCDLLRDESKLLIDD